MQRFVILTGLIVLAHVSARGETPNVLTSSGRYEMQSTVDVLGVSQAAQSGGTYQIESKLDSDAFITPVELSVFEVE